MKFGFRDERVQVIPAVEAAALWKQLAGDSPPSGFVALHYFGFGYDVIELRGEDGVPSEANPLRFRARVLVLHRAGFPCTSLGEHIERSNLQEAPAHDVILPLHDRHLPLLPIWSGFAINTLTYAALIWLPFVAPFQLRRFVRGRRKQCLRCGYDLRASENKRCPECGTASR